VLFYCCYIQMCRFRVFDIIGTARLAPISLYYVFLTVVCLFLILVKYFMWHVWFLVRFNKDMID